MRQQKRQAASVATKMTVLVMVELIAMDDGRTSLQHTEHALETFVF